MTDDEDRRDRVRNSRAYGRARGKAREYLHNPGELDNLVARARRKAAGISRGPFTDLWDSLMTALRLLRAYARGQYRDVPWQSLVLIVAAIVYFVMPLDLVPDFLAGFGFLDDAVLLGWTLKTVEDVLADFEAWESGHGDKSDGDTGPPSQR